MFQKKCVGALSICFVAAILLAAAPAWAQKGRKGGGKNPPPKYSVVELAEMYWPSDMSEPPNGQTDLWVAGRSVDSDAGVIEAMYARITPWGDVTVDFLPEVGDPQGSYDGHSHAWAVNNLGDVAGSAAVLDNNSDEFSHAVVWIRSGNSFSYIDLDQDFDFEFSEANDLNNDGIAVGEATLGGVDHARVWDLITGSSDDLNDFLPVGSDWILTEATQVNDSGMIGGKGLLDGYERGFVLTLETDPQTNQTLATVTAVPLLPGGGPYNDLAALTEDGQVTGRATIWDETRGVYAQRAYYWDGTSNSPSVNLGTLTDWVSGGAGVNIRGEVVGTSHVPPYRGSLESFATYWGTDQVPVSLEDEIPSKPKWKLDYATDINDDGYVLAHGGKSYRGDVIWMAIILVPNSP